MSNKSLAVALALSLKSAAIIAQQIVDTMQDADNERLGNQLSDVIGAIFDRRTGTVGSAAVTPTETPEAVPTFVAEAAPAAAPVVEANQPPENPLQVITDMLNDPRYTLRSLSSLAEKSGLSEGDVIYELDNNDIDYVTRTKRGSGAKLIGLDSRN